MDHLTFGQQVFMALAHGGPPCVVALLSYLSIMRAQKKHAQAIMVQLNGDLERKIRAAITEPKDSIGE